MYQYQFEADGRIIRVEPQESGKVGLRIHKARHGRGVFVELDEHMVQTLSEILILAGNQASQNKG